MSTPGSPTTEVNSGVEIIDRDVSLARMRAHLGTGAVDSSLAPYNKLTGVTQEIAAGSVAADATVFFSGCTNCVFTVNATCSKIMVQSCSNLTLTVNSKVVTACLEMWKCADVTLMFNTNLGTMQLDNSENINITISVKENFKQLVWAATETLKLSFGDDATQYVGGFAQEKETDARLEKEIDQFIVRTDPLGKVICEQLVRLKNGFPSTERETKAFDAREEANLQKMLKSNGIHLKPQSAAQKGTQGRNEPCNCNSGKKYKACCGKG
jgi:hypothetical protein